MQDFEQKPTASTAKPFKWHTFRILVEILILILLMGIFLKQPHTPLVSAPPLKTLSPIPPQSEPLPPSLPVKPPYLVVKVNPGDTLEKIFQKQGLDKKTTRLVLNSGKPAAALKKLTPGQEIQLLLETDPKTPQKSLQELHLTLSPTKTLIIQANQDRYRAQVIEIPLITENRVTVFTLKSRLGAAIQEAGLPRSLVGKLATIFTWNLNFSRDLHPGDVFRLKYEASFDEHHKLIDIHKILAVEIQRGTKTYQAILYKDKTGNEDYYTLQGKSLSQAFLRWPIAHGRISSPFSLGRFHPILGYIRPHTGTDFAAPYGTPIRATAKGQIIQLGRNGGYGNVIMIKHFNGYETLYAHMSRFASGLSVGSHVKQNQTIGYIGTSGLSDGPHVHYEVRVNGQFRDPMKVKLPTSLSLSPKEMAVFEPYAQAQLADLKRGSK